MTGGRRAEPYRHPIEGRAGDEPWQQHQQVRPAGAALGLGGRGLVVVGEGDFDPRSVFEAAGGLGWPVLATATSGLRVFDVVTTYHHLLVTGVPTGLQPDLVVTVGRTGPSDRVGSLTSLPVPQVQVDRWGAWNDPRRHSSHLLQADPAQTLVGFSPAPDDRLFRSWLEADVAMRSALDDHLAADETPSGPAVARAIEPLDEVTLIAASSMPIRDVDAHVTKTARVIANRGASGIDGFVSTALGAASATTGAVAFAGDLSFLHDATGLVADDVGDVVFVVVDNGGGGLFDLLPQAEHAPAFERLFVAPHDLDLSRVASAYDLSASVVEDVAALGATIRSRLDAGGAHVVVVPVDREADLKTRRGLDDTSRGVCASFS